MQAWSLERKIQVTQTRIIEWYQHWDGQVYVSFSGGKDSTVLLNLVRRIYPETEAVFFDTGLEFPEIRKFVKSIENVTWIRPKLTFPDVIKKWGYPIISKEVAERIFYAKRGKEWAINALNGKKSDGTISEYRQGNKKFSKLIDSPFNIGHRCCAAMKKNPSKNFEKKSGKKPYIGTMTEESGMRKTAWLKTGCNGFEGRPMSTPMAFWTEQDVLKYLQLTDIPYCDVYGDIIEEKGKLKTTGRDRTGCMFCMFGVHLEKEPNRFQRMKTTHPKQYEYCMKPVKEGGLGLATVLDYIGVKYE